MSTGNELIPVARWILATLAGSAVVTDICPVATAIHRSVAPDKAPDTNVIYQLQTPERDYGLVQQGGERLWSPQLWLIVVEKRGSSLEGDVVTLADEIDRLFHNPPQEAYAGYSVLSSKRQMPFMLPNFERGQRFERVGGVYRILARAPSS